MKLGVSKDTVNKYVKEYVSHKKEISNEINEDKIALIQKEMCAAPKRKSATRKALVFTGDLQARFYELIRIDEERNKRLGINKQQLTAALIHRTLCSEGYVVGKTTIAEQFKKYKDKHKECFIKQDYDYGYRAEYDFHHIKVLIKGKVRKFCQVTITLPKSNIIFVKYYENEKLESFIDSLVCFLNFCGGVPITICFDNMKNVVKKFVYKGDKEYNDELIKLSNYYGFKIITTNPYSGNEKGHVETSGKHIRKELFSLRYEFDSLEGLLLYSDEALRERNESKKTLFNLERKAFLPLPTHQYELGRPTRCFVNKYSLISVDANFYSVPDIYVNKTVNCNVYINRITVYNDKDVIIAEHIKKEGKGDYALNLFHYVETFKRKPGALENSLALKQAPKVLQTFFCNHFITDPKSFLDILTNMSLDDILELAVKFGYCRKKYIKTNPKYIGLKRNYTIEEVSSNQLKTITTIFKQEI